MKFRTDFITNSSSSSYICAFGKIEDQDQANEITKAHSDIQILTKEMVQQMKNGNWGSAFECDWAGVYLGINVDEDKDNSEYVWFESYGGAGDSDCAFENRCGDIEYDVEFCDFETEEQDIVDKMSNDSVFSNVSVGFGAGRNG